MTPEAAESLRVIDQWAARGLVFYNDLETRSTRTRAVCPQCGADRSEPECVCGWEQRGVSRAAVRRLRASAGCVPYRGD